MNAFTLENKYFIGKQQRKIGALWQLKIWVEFKEGSRGGPVLDHAHRGVTALTTFIEYN